MLQGTNEGVSTGAGSGQPHNTCHKRVPGLLEVQSLLPHPQRLTGYSV